MNFGSKKRILDGEPTTRDWTNEQIQEILKKKTSIQWEINNWTSYLQCYELSTYM